jgi:hypothetical protein
MIPVIIIDCGDTYSPAGPYKINQPAIIKYNTLFFAEGTKVLKNFGPNDPNQHLFSHIVNRGYNYLGVYTDGQNTKSFKG